MDYLWITLQHLLWGTVWVLISFGALLVTLGVIDVVRALYRRSRKD